MAFVNGMHTSLYMAAVLTLVAAGLSSTRIRSRRRRQEATAGSRSAAEAGP